MKKTGLIIIVAILAATVVATTSVTAEDADARVVNINTDGYLLTVDLDDDALTAKLMEVNTEKGVLELSTIDYEGKTYSVTAVHDCILKNNETVTNVRLPNVVTVGDNAFSISLACYINLDSAKDIGSYAFEGCENLYLWMPSCTTIRQNAFSDVDILRVTFGPLEFVHAGAFPDYSFYDLDGVLITADSEHLANKSFARKSPHALFEEPGAGYTFSSGGLNYELIGSGGAKVVGGSPSADGTLSIPNITHYSSLSGNYVVPVTEIGDRAFFGNKDIRCLKAPYVNKIGIRAFYECTNMVSAEFSDSNGLSAVATFSKLSFYRCTGLTELTIPATTKTIGTQAFRGCTGLTIIDKIPESASVDHDAFYGFHFYMPDGTTEIACDSDAFPGHQYTGKYSKMIQVGDVLPKEIVQQDGLLFEVVDFNGVTGTVRCLGSDPQYEPRAFYNIPPSLTYKGYDLTVTSIVSNAFKDDKALVSVNFPYTLKSIGSKAFANCSNLETATIRWSGSLKGIGSYAFYGTSLNEIDLPEGLETIGKSAFNGPKPGFVFVPGTVSSIGETAFNKMKLYDSDGVTSLDATVENMSGYSFLLIDGKYIRQAQIGSEFEVDGLLFKSTYVSMWRCEAELSGYTHAPADLVVPDKVTFAFADYSVTSIGNKAFYGCSAVKSLDAQNVSSIGSKSFASSGLKSIKLGDDLVEIGSYAFYKCPIKELVLPYGIESIGSSAFSGCTSLERVCLTSDYEYGSNVFHGLTFYFPDGTTVISPGDLGFGFNTYSGSDRKLVMEQAEVDKIFSQGCLSYRITYIDGRSYGTADVVGFTPGKAVADVEVPEQVQYGGYTFDVKEIASRAFYGDSTIRSISMPCIDIVGTRAFTKSTLESAVLDCVHTIGGYAFYDCPLTDIVLPEVMESIGKYAFYGCKSLSSIYIPECEYGTKAFSGIQFYYCDGTRSLTPSSPDFPNHLYTGHDSILMMEACMSGDRFDIGLLKYEITSTDAAFTAKVVGFADGQSGMYISVPESVNTGSRTYVVDEIGYKAFYKNSSIKSIDLRHVTKVDERAFASSGLENVELPVQGTIGEYAFFGCHMTSLYIPEGIYLLDDSAFSKCTSITRLSVFAPQCEYGNNVFYGLKLYRSDGTTRIAESDFHTLAGHVYEGADGVLVQKLVVEVGEIFEADVLKYKVTYATDSEYRAEVIGFADGASSKIVDVSPYVKMLSSNGRALISIDAIGTKAFYRNSTVEEIHTNGPMSIGERAFTSCSKLHVIDLDGGESSIGKYAFYGCQNVVRADFSILTSIKAHAFDGFVFHDANSGLMDTTVDNLSERSFRGNDSTTLSVYL
ncbi:MAG: leucine-rich repeat protein [Candidatus Methanomethylophilaceae archaeon]|nr:leucine-rich repeat protein [Candidatus Methanomethylophilaceae archaeon]